MKFTPSPPALVRVLDATIASLGGVERRKMFGYPAIFVRGKMIAGLVRNRMIVRLSATDRAAFLAWAQSDAFRAAHSMQLSEGLLEGHPRARFYDAVLVESPAAGAR